mgnify:CR=1 FL=1
MDPKSEIDWLAAIAASQDETAFSSLFARYAPRIKGYMMRQGVDATTAEELAQELSLIHISEPTRQESRSRMPSSA